MHRSVILLPLLVACGGEDDSLAGLFDDGVTDIVVEVDYEVGAEPYVDDAPNGQPFWGLTRVNVERLFPNRTVTVPVSLDEMEELPAQAGDDSFTVEELVAIAAENQDAAETATSKTLYIVFLDGMFEEGGATKQNILGVSVTGTRVIGMFKPVIRNSEGPIQVVSRFVEQSVIIHELGHGIGLVNNGLPLTSDHHDEENGAHCTNQQCVMYFANEGVTDLIEFVQDRMNGGDFVLFGDECLADVDEVN